MISVRYLLLCVLLSLTIYQGKWRNYIFFLILKICFALIKYWHFVLFYFLSPYQVIFFFLRMPYVLFQCTIIGDYFLLLLFSYFIITCDFVCCLMHSKYTFSFSLCLHQNKQFSCHLSDALLQVMQNDVLE